MDFAAILINWTYFGEKDYIVEIRREPHSYFGRNFGSGVMSNFTEEMGTYAWDLIDPMGTILLGQVTYEVRISFRPA